MKNETEFDRSTGPRPDILRPIDALHPDERLKLNSRGLRASIRENLANPVTGGVPTSDAKILKFHGIYQQDDRDIRAERRRQKLEPAYGFMVRIRIPGGVLNPGQFVALTEISHRHADGALRLTTRQTIQLHAVRKHSLRPVIKALKHSGLDTIAACGDDSRGVMCAVNPALSTLHREVHALSRLISDRVIPRTAAYGEIWLDEVAEAARVEEPLYGQTYLPRKFKIGIAVPPYNEIDVFAQDLGLIAIPEKSSLSGFNLCVGGGLGHTDRDPSTYPRLADSIGYVPKQRILEVIESTIAIQRDFGDRVDRSHARFKYTLEKRGLDWFKSELEHRSGVVLENPRSAQFASNDDPLGWQEGQDGKSHYTMFIENGRIRDRNGSRLPEGLREIARVHRGEFRITPNQNLMIAQVRPEHRGRIQDLIDHFGFDAGVRYSGLRQRSITCVALPTCGLAMAESERALPGLISRIEKILAQTGLNDFPITIRMSGCPNGCSRPYLAEIGLTGRAPGKYNLYLGGAPNGTRLNRLYRENIGEDRIVAELEELIRRFAADRVDKERFGDFVIRQGIVAAVANGRDFKTPMVTG